VRQRPLQRNEQGRLAWAFLSHGPSIARPPHDGAPSQSSVRPTTDGVKRIEPSEAARDRAKRSG
jgi:hypothetical protein